MDLKQIEKLMMAMERSTIKRVALKREGFEIELEKESASDHYIPAPPPPVVQELREQERPASASEAPVESKHEVGCYVTSPMVGTFYSGPSPDEPPFVKVGDQIDENTVLCIVEAMKVMNEVKAGMSGKVVEILLKNGDPVEFGTQIFRVES